MACGCGPQRFLLLHPHTKTHNGRDSGHAPFAPLVRHRLCRRRLGGSTLSWCRTSSLAIDSFSDPRCQTCRCPTSGQAMTDSHSARPQRDGSRARVPHVPRCMPERHSPVTFGLRSFRCLVAARLSAIWLIVLIVSPWNAPFATSDDAISSNHASDGRTTVSWEPGTASTEDPNVCALPPAARRWDSLRLEHSIGVESVIGPITVAEVSLEESNRPSPAGRHALSRAVLRL